MTLQPIFKGPVDRSKVSKAITVPPPIEGWVSMNDARANNLTSARILTNIVPGRTYMESRRGMAKVATLGTNTPVEALMSYTSGATRKLLAASGNKLFVSEEAPAITRGLRRTHVFPKFPSALAAEIGSGFSNNRWQSICMADGSDTVRLLMVNGADGIKNYNHTEGLTTVTPTPNIPDLICVTNFKSRAWFCQKGTSILYYGEPLSNKPTTLTPFYVGPLLRQGGEIVAINSVSLDGGSGPDDYLIAVSSRGEILVFSGIDPATDFSMVGLFNTAEPLGPRSLYKVGNDLMYYGSRGPEALGKLYGGLGRVDVIGNGIQPEFEDAIARSGSSFGWEMILDTNSSWVICNVPIVPPGQMEQYAINLETQGWFRITGWNANCWVQHNTQIYFGDSKGNVFLANYGLSDDGKPIDIDYMCSWNNFTVPYVKKFTQCKITVKSITRPNPQIDMMVDYEEKLPQSAVGFSFEVVSSPWNVSPWNISPWSSSPMFFSNLFGLNNHGFVGGLRYREKILDSVLQIYGYQVLFEEGRTI